MAWNGDVVLATFDGGQSEMATGLAGDPVPEIGEGRREIVTVVGPNGEQRPVTFQPGVVGAERTQVLSGLFDGQEVVLPSGL